MMKTEATVSQPTAPAGSPLMQVSGALIGINCAHSGGGLGD